MTARRQMSARRARSIATAATLVKHPTWSETRQWQVVADDGTVLVVVAPSYGGISRTGRNGWRYWLADHGPTGNREHWPTRQGAAAAGLAAWERWITSPPSR